MKQSSHYAAAMRDPCLVQVLDMVRRVEAQAPDDLTTLAKASTRRNDAVAKWFERRRHAVIQAAADASERAEALAAAHAEIARLRQSMAANGDFESLKASRDRLSLTGGSA